ncbi:MULTISPECIES: DNA polymerase III subunit delta [Caproicibacterium]|uniref:DNA polymerase III subunit delta n=1 Tax=Caproicibacterium argilliputei TaxID=3030016 RepID=A0AA97H473_9FIRM|nr:DNA polymerase III subunit delta [Caproicibacterium argilliputei]WOC33093.1 DNA polymerase III subunit delta [Caproicibacterium argilliputei]
MAHFKEAELKKQMEADTLSGVYFLYGEEKYMVSVWAQRLIRRAAGKEFLDFNLQRFSGEVSADALDDAVQALPFMAPRKCVAVADLSLDGRAPSELKKLAELLGDVPETTVLVLSFAASDPPLKKEKKWKDLFALCQEKGVCVECTRRTQSDLEKLLVAAAKKRGCVLSRTLAARMYRYVGNDLTALLNELEKVCAFTGEGEIREDTVDRLVTRNLETRVYDLSKALLAGRYERAYQVLGQLLDQNEEPVRILAVLSGAYVDLYRVRTALQSGESALEPARHFPEYRNREFRLTNAERDTHDLSTQMLRASLEVLLRADLDLKGSRTDSRLILERTLARLLVIAKEEERA